MTGAVPTAEMERLVQKVFPSGAVERITPLAGDASARRYFRVSVGDSRSVVVMLAEDERAVGDFATMTGLMRDLGADTPAIHAASGRFAVLEDLGDTLLQDAVSGGMGARSLEEEYRRHVDDLLRFQERAAEYPDRSLRCFSLAFDEEKLMWEVEFANEHFLKGWLKRKIGPAALDGMRREWGRVACDLAGETETLAHRDLHSRNIMLTGERRVWIDYQDARMGRRQYDLASLLLDPYTDLPADVERALADYYYEKLSETSRPPWSHGRFIELYRLSGVQRLYKALGTYGYQASVRGVDAYSRHIPPAARTLMRLLGSSESLAALAELLRDALDGF